MCASPYYLCIPVRELLIINLNQLLQMLVLSLSISLGLREQLLRSFRILQSQGRITNLTLDEILKRKVCQ